MKTIHIVIPDLFLPRQLAAYAIGDLHFHALEMLLARAQPESLNIDSLESWLCARFGLAAMAIAPLTLQADGLTAEEGYWLRADPVSFKVQRDQLVLQVPSALYDAEAAQLCASLNAHFLAEGLRFFAPHPLRWYLRLEQAPAIATQPLPQVVGADMHAHLPDGMDALRWHSVLNEIQMLFYEHPVNQAREQRGETPVNGVWLWGGGKMAGTIQRPFAAVAGESVLASAFARAAGIPQLGEVAQVLAEGGDDCLLVCDGLRSALQGADIGAWRNALQQFEKNYAEPLLAALRKGEVGRLILDVPNEGSFRRFTLSRPALWKVWRRPRRLLHYALAQHTP